MVGARIKEFLRSRGIKQNFLVEKTGLSAVTISDIVNSNRKIEVTEYVRICTALDVPLDTFVKDMTTTGKEE